jgi:hypothetical protein
MEEEQIENATSCEMITNEDEEIVVIDSIAGTCLKIQVRYPNHHILKANRDYLYDMIGKVFYHLSQADEKILLDMQCGKNKSKFLLKLLNDYLMEV